MGGLDESKMTIIAGSEDPANPIPDNKINFVQEEKIDNVKIHPLSDYPAAKYDLALVKIKGQFTFRNSIWPICMPEKTQPREYHFSRGYIMLGFGRDINKVNKGSVLTELDLDVQPTRACSTIYGRILSNEFDEFHYTMKNTFPKNFTEDSLLCASKPGRTSGSCPGDSGGILMRNEWMPDLNDYKNIQIAVVHGAAQKCNGGRYPAIFVRIDTFEALYWINQITFSNNSEIKWRQDRRCGTDYLSLDGTPAQCNPTGPLGPQQAGPCCSEYGYCGGSPAHCKCFKCIDYRTGDRSCNTIKVTGDDYASVTGMYVLSEEKASKIPNYPVYRLFKNAKVLCGSHYAESCAGCPQEHGANWCGGWCKWANENGLHENCIFDESKRDKLLNRYIYYNPGEKGWRIGDKVDLSGEYEGNSYYQSYITKKQFWLDKDTAWRSYNSPDDEVKVECVET